LDKRKTIKIHFVFWITVLFLQVIAALSEIGFLTSGVIVIHNLVEIMFKAFFFYSAYSYLSPWFYKKERVVIFIISLIVFIVIFNLLFTYLYILAKYPTEEMPAMFSGSFRFNYFDLITIDFVYAAIGSLLRVTLTWYVKAKKQDEFEMQNIADELSLIQSKLNPEFLFSTLDKINSLIAQNKDKASHAVILLSEMMRYMLNDAGMNKAMLEDEVEMIRSFVELQNLRTDKGKFAIFTAKGDLHGISLPPLILFPIVENSFGYFEGSLVNPEITIALNVSNGHISFEASKHFIEIVNEPEANAYKTMKSFTKRLDMVFENRYDLNILQKDNEYCVKLDINYL